MRMQRTENLGQARLGRGWAGQGGQGVRGQAGLRCLDSRRVHIPLSSAIPVMLETGAWGGGGNGKKEGRKG